MNFVDEEKSWYLLAILLKIGRPAFPEEIASQCKLFPAISPDFIRYISSVSDSPLCLVGNGLVSVSMAAMFAFGKFASVAMNSGFVWNYGFWASEPKGLGDADEEKKCRKRKGTVLDMVEFSKAKRRLFFSSTEGERCQNRLSITNGIQEISTEKYVDTANFMMRRTSPAIRFESGNMHSGRAMIPLTRDTYGKFSCCPTPNIEYREADNHGRRSLFLQGEISGSVHNSSDSLLVTGRYLTCQKPVEADRFMACKIAVNSALPINFQDPLLCKEALVEDIGFEDDICKFQTCKISKRDSNEDEGMQVESGSKEVIIDCGAEREKVNITLVDKPALYEQEIANTSDPENEMHALNLGKDETVRNIETEATLRLDQPFSTPKQLLRSAHKLKGEHKNDVRIKPQILKESLTYNKFDNIPKDIDQCKIDQNFITKQKLKQGRNSNANAKENMLETASITPKMSGTDTHACDFSSRGRGRVHVPLQTYFVLPNVHIDDTPFSTPIESTHIASSDASSTQGSSVAMSITAVCGLTDSRLLVRPNGKEFIPSTGTVGVISSIMKAKYEQPWTGWKDIPQKVRDMWWNEFQKYCRWDSQHDVAIRRIWGLKCADTVRANLASIRNCKSKGKWLSIEVFDALWVKWRTDPEFKEKSKRNKKNRSISEGGCLYRGGSISMSEHKRRYTRELGREATIPELFCKLNHNDETN